MNKLACESKNLRDFATGPRWLHGGFNIAKTVVSKARPPALRALAAAQRVVEKDGGLCGCIGAVLCHRAVRRQQLAGPHSNRRSCRPLNSDGRPAAHIFAQV